VQEGLTGVGIAWGAWHIHFSNWHPLTWLSYMLDYELFDLYPRRYHLTNMFLARRGGDSAVPGAAADDGSMLAQRVGGGGFRDSSPAGRIGWRGWPSARTY